MGRKQKIDFLSRLRPLSLCAALLVFSSSLQAGEKEQLERVFAHLLIGDYPTALTEAKLAVIQFPHSKEVRGALVETYAQVGLITEAYQEWKQLAILFPEMKEEGALLEKLAWGVLSHAGDNPQLLVHFSSLVGAFLTRDARAVPVLLSNMRSSNASIRALAVRFAGMYGDKPLIEQLKKMLAKERVWFVRLEVLQALGHLRIGQIEEELRRLIVSPNTVIEERGAASEALAHLLQQIERPELEALAKSSRMGLRFFAARAISHFDRVQDRDLLFHLLDDHSNEVRCAALTALGLMGIHDERLKKEAQELSLSSNQAVAITAGWALLLSDRMEGYRILYPFTKDPHPPVRHLATAAIAASGSQGWLLAKKIFRQTRDPYIRLNLALLLLGDEELSFEAADAIEKFMCEREEKIMVHHFPGTPFQAIVPSEISHIPDIPQYPLIVDQTTRLSLFNALAIAGHPGAVEAMKTFLKKQTGQISFMAASYLIDEGGADAVEAVKNLLADPDPWIRLQAALVLAFIGEEEPALEVLKELYLVVDRQQQLQIIEVMGRFPAKKTLPFLIEGLGSSSHVLRVAAASSLIQALSQ